MANITLIESPIFRAPDNITCSVVAAYNDIVFKFNKSFNETTNVRNMGGDVGIEIIFQRVMTDAELNNAFTLGVWFFLTPTQRIDMAIDGYSRRGQTTVLTATPTQTIESGAYAVLLKDAATDYRLQLWATNDAGESVKASFTPAPNGDIYADISAFARASVSPDKKNAKLTLKTVEVTNGVSAPSQALPALNVVYAALDFPSQYGANLAEYSAKGTGYGHISRFITTFDEPEFYPGYPFALSYILGDAAPPNVQILQVMNQLDINKQPIPGIAEQVKPLGFLPTGMYEIDDIPVLDPRTRYLKLRVRAPAGELIEPKFLKVIDDCPDDNYVLLRWINHIGGNEQFRFGYNNDRQTAITNNVMLSRTVRDLRTGFGSVEVSRKTSTGSTTIGVDGTKEFEGFESLVNSIRVQKFIRWYNDKWVTVALTPGTYDFGQARDKVKNYKFTLIEQEKNIQRI